MRILVTGGAGYIGSHVAHLLVDQGHDVTVIDLLREAGGTGNQWAVPSKAKLFRGSCGDKNLLAQVFSGERFDTLLHFAAFILVDESMREPARYYENNVVNSLRLFEFALKNRVKNIVFSSTCAVYGNAGSDADGELISEAAPLAPINPYGHSKQMTEQILRDLCLAQSGTQYAILRYFNPAGAYSDLRIGQARPTSSHLVNVAAEAAVGTRSKVQVFGSDYPTQDGTCLRDYIHIQDLAEAHVLTLRYLANGGPSDVFNVGYGRPFSVKEVLAEMKRVSKPIGGKDFAIETMPRRIGDPARMGANADKIRRLMGWMPKYDSLSLICESHFKWEQLKAQQRQHQHEMNPTGLTRQ